MNCIKAVRVGIYKEVGITGRLFGIGVSERIRLLVDTKRIGVSSILDRI